MSKSVIRRISTQLTDEELPIVLAESFSVAVLRKALELAEKIEAEEKLEE